MRNINVTPAFVLAGEATFTVSNGSGKHYTYHVYKGMPNAVFANEAWFIKVLCGPNNETDYQYMGMVKVLPGRTPLIKLTSKSRFVGTKVWSDSAKGKEAAQAVKVAEWALRVIWQVEAGTYTLPDHMSIKHDGKCGRCGAKLTTPESIDTGMGEKCAMQVGIEWRERSGERSLDLGGNNSYETNFRGTNPAIR